MKDWDFTLFSPNRLDRDHPYGLRRHRNFSSDRLYHYVIIADLVLRFSWLWRVVPGLTWLPETESGLFLLMFLEVARRWMWVFFRIEAEWSKFPVSLASAGSRLPDRYVPSTTISVSLFYSLTISFLCNSSEHPRSRRRGGSAWRFQSQVRRGLNRNHQSSRVTGRIFALFFFSFEAVHHHIGTSMRHRILVIDSSTTPSFCGSNECFPRHLRMSTYVNPSIAIRPVIDMRP